MGSLSHHTNLPFHCIVIEIMFKCKPPGAKPLAGRYVRVLHNKIMEKKQQVQRSIFH